jgi:hypothetical protein
MKLNITSAISFGDADLVASAILIQLGAKVPLGMVRAFLDAKEAGLLVANATGKYFSISRDGMLNNAPDHGISGCPDIKVALFTYKKSTARIQVLRSSDGHATCQQP